MIPDETNLAPLAGLDVLRAESAGYSDGLAGRDEPSEEVLADETGFLLERYRERRQAGASEAAMRVAFAAGRNGYWRLSEETQRDRTGALLALSLEAHKRGAAVRELEKRRAG